MIDVTGLDPFSLRELGGAVGRWKLVGVSGSCIDWLDNRYSRFDHLGAEGSGKIRKNKVFFAYEWVIQS